MNNKKKDNHPISIKISKLFDKDNYIIPMYQRNYAWGETEIIQLLDDIEDAEDGKDYYIGSLIVDQKDLNNYEVIDGQQRLTTLFLLNVYLGTPGLSRDSLSFQARKKSNDTLKTIDTENYKRYYGNEQFSEEILDGFRIIEEYFRKHDNMKRFNKKLNDVTILRTQVPKNIDLNHYFEIMNTRGEQLELHEIVKEKMLKVLESGNVKEEVRDFCAIIWDACSNMERYFQINLEKELREKVFGESWDSIRIKEIYKMDDLNSKGEKSSKKARLEDILNRPDEYSDKKSNDNESKDKIRFDSIITFPYFLLQVNAAMKSEDTEDDVLLDDKKLLDELKEHWKDKEHVFNFLENLIKYRFLFDKYIIKREYAKKYSEDGNWSLKKLKKYDSKADYVITYENEEADDDKKNDRIKMLQSCLRVTYTSPKTMHWIHILLKELNKNENADQIRILEDYSKKKVRASIKDYRDFEMGINLDRIVFTYLDYMLWRESQDTYSDFHFQFRKSIEHFYPQHPLNNYDTWREGKPLHDFGNLALLTVSGNSKFSNHPPIVKKTNEDIVKQSPKLQRMIDTMEKNGDEWNETTVKIHGEEMIGLIKMEIEDLT